MNDTSLVNFKINLTLLNLFNGTTYIISNSTTFWIRHQTTRA